MGNNAFFVKREASDLPEVTIQEAWRDGVYRESRGEQGQLTFLSLQEGRKLLSDMLVIDVISGEEKKIGDLIL